MKNKSTLVMTLTLALGMGSAFGARSFAKPFPPKGEYLEDFRYAILQDNRCWNAEYGFINCDINAALVRIKNNCEVYYTVQTECQGNCPAITIAGELTAVQQVKQLKLICERL